MKKKILKFFSIFMICIIGTLCVGCIGNDSNYASSLKERYENGELSYEEYLDARMGSQTVPLYGTKVLYRPDNYDWEGNVGEGNQDYYGQFSWWILNNLTTLYGYTIRNQYNAAVFPDDDKIKSGFYDSIRYQMESYDLITLQKINISDKSSTVDESNYIQATANTTKKWNWSLGLQVNDTASGIENQVFLYDNSNFAPERYGVKFGYKNGNVVYLPSNQASLQQNRLSNVSYPNTGSIDDLYNYMNTFYNALTTNYYQNYSKLYIGTAPDESFKLNKDMYSDYVKTLEYAIYCFSLNLVPSTNIQVEYTNGVPSVLIDGYSATDALKNIQDTFKKYGTFVGFTTRLQEKLIDWICSEVIGTNTDNTFNISTSKRTLVQYVKNIDTDGDGATDTEVMCSEDGTETDTFAPVEKSYALQENISVNRDYQNKVANIVNACVELVHIGTVGEEESEPNINNKYLASHIVDYFGNDFFISSDDPFANLPAREYQSVALMFRKDFEFSNLSIAFKYDANGDGDENVVPNASIRISVQINWYTQINNQYRKLTLQNDANGIEYDTFEIEVPDGAYDYGTHNHDLMLYGFKDKREDGIYSIQVGKFNTEIGNGILKSITDGYIGEQSIGQELALSGNDLRRGYYELVEPTDNSDSLHYGYGRLNHNKFAGADGCDYIEIVYQVTKVVGGGTTKFHTGLKLVA